MGRAVSPLDLAFIVSNVYFFLLFSRIILRRDKAAQAQQLNINALTCLICVYYPNQNYNSHLPTPRRSLINAMLI